MKYLNSKEREIEDYGYQDRLFACNNKHVDVESPHLVVLPL